MHRQGRSGGPNENIHQRNLDPIEEYIGDNSGVINLDLTLGRSTRPENYRGENLVDGREEVCGSIKAKGNSTVSLPLKRNRRLLEGESSSRGAHQAAPSSENDNGNIRFILREREGDHVSNSHFHDQMGSRPVLGPPGTLNTITPCAACRLLRRRCAQECLFSPYFSPHEPQKFASVHKVFGASNVSKMLKEVPECQRANVANSLVYEANTRLRDPVYGCVSAISALQQRVQSLQAELNAVRAEIHMNMNMNMIPPSSHHHVKMLPSSVSIAAPPSPPPPPPTNSSSSS